MRLVNVVMNKGQKIQCSHCYRMADAVQANLDIPLDFHCNACVERATSVGPYSGLTASELRKSGTCETDWF